MPSRHDKKKHAGGDGIQTLHKEIDSQKSALIALEELKKNLDDAVKDVCVKNKCQTVMTVKTHNNSRHYPDVSRSIVKTKKWCPPAPQKILRKVEIQLPPLTLRRWIPPKCRKRKQRPKLFRIPPEDVSQPLYEYTKLRKVWHNFVQVKKNMMMLQGTTACNSKRYSPQHCGVQTACIAAVCTALLDEKNESQLTRKDVDDVIDNADRYYHQCMLNLKCFTGPPSLEIKHLLNDFFLHDTKYSVRFEEADRGVLMKSTDGLSKESELMDLLEKRAGSKFCVILTLGRAKHFLVWGHPPDAESGSQVKTIVYMFDPHMLNDIGQPQKLFGAGAFLRYPGVQSFVFDFLANYADLDQAQKGLPMPQITLTDVEIGQKQPLIRDALWDLDLKTCKIHCQSEWDSMNKNLLYQKKFRGEYPLESLSAVSLATSKARSKVKLRDFYHRKPNADLVQVVPPVVPDKGPKGPTVEQIMAYRGENFFLYCATQDAHAFGRDDLAGVMVPKNEEILHSLVDIADKNCSSQYVQLDVGKWLLRATRHMASFRYQKFLTYTAIACCVAALAVQRRLRARSWNEDTLDETLDVGFNLFRESLSQRGGPIRRLVLGELTDTFVMRDKEYKFTEKGIVVWGKIFSTDQKVFDICRGIDHFFKESDSGVLQIPGEVETAIMHEGDRYYIYIPWPADFYGKKLDIRAGGKACCLYFDRTSRLCDYFLDNWAFDLRRKPFSISAVHVFERTVMPEPVNFMKAVDQNRWVIRGTFHEADERFPEEHRGKQATPISIVAIALANISDPDEWKSTDVNEALERGDILYQSTIEHLDRMGIGIDTAASNKKGGEEAEAEDITGEEDTSGPTGTLAAIDVLSRFKVTDTDCIETEILDSAYTGTIPGSRSDGILSLRESLQQLFKLYQYAVLTARGGSMAVWKHNNCYYFFDPHGCDENGYPTDDMRATACLVRVRGSPTDLADTIESNLTPGVDDSFNLSPVVVTATKLHPVQGVPETTLEWNDLAFGEMDGEDGDKKVGENIGAAEEAEAEETGAAVQKDLELEKAMQKKYLEELERWKESKAYEWYSKDSRGTAAIMVGPRGENSAIGKAATKAGIGEEDQAGRNLGLAAAAAFTAATATVPPPHMHQDHMFNFLDAGADYYNAHVKKTGRKELNPEDLTEKFEMGANTFSIELGEPIKMTLRIPDETTGEGGGGGADDAGEEVDDSPKHMKDILNIMWNDTTKPTTVSLLVGDYHQLGVWMTQGGKIVAFDPAPTLLKGLLINQRIIKGDELRNQRLKDEMTGEDIDDEDDELGGEGEEKPEALPEEVPPESCPVLMVFAGPGEFMDKLASQGPLTPIQTKAPYKLYPVKVTNELTTLLKDRRPAPAAHRGGEGEGEEEDAGDTLVEELVDEAMGPYFSRMGRSAASIRGRVSQNEHFFLDKPNRDHQDAANCIMAIVVDHIEPYRHWKPVLIDAILKYGDRLYTTSLPYASKRPTLCPEELINQFHVTSFNVTADVSPVVVSGDVKAGKTGAMLDLSRAIKQFFDEGHTHGVLCCKNYCAAIWKDPEGKAFCYWDPHAVGPRGGPSPGGSATLVLFSNIEEMADTFKANMDVLARPGNNKFTIQAVKVQWEYSKLPAQPQRSGGVPDDTYEWKVLTAYVETDRGKTILRGSRPLAPVQFAMDAMVQSSSGAIVAGCMSQIRRPALWTTRTVDEIMSISSALFTKSVCSLGYEFRPGDDMLLPLQVATHLVIGVNFVLYELQQIFTGRLESRSPNVMSVRAAVESFFNKYQLGILWAGPFAVALWKEESGPRYYLMEPHSCGITGLRTDNVDDGGAACVMTFSSPKLLAYHYLQNTAIDCRDRQDYILYAMSVVVKPIKKPKSPSRPSSQHSVRGDKDKKTKVKKVVPATSKVHIDGKPRRAEETARTHPPGVPTCEDTMRTAEKKDKEDEEIQKMLRGQRSPNGWLIMCDGSSFLSASHSMTCRKFSNHSKGNQAIPMSIMAVAMSRVDDICKWNSRTLDQILFSGDQLYQDSILHFRPQNSKILAVEQVLRKFYTPGNCVCRVVIFNPRQSGFVNDDLVSNMTTFFTEEKCGILVANRGVFAVALFRNNKGYFMFDPADRDRYGRAVAEPCLGKARACFSHYLNVKTLCAKLAENVPPDTPEEAVAEPGPTPSQERRTSEKAVAFSLPEAGEFTIYGMGITGLRRLTNQEM